jgi:signal transduction histidine kinase
LTESTPADRSAFLEAVAALNPENPTSEVTYRFLRPSGGVVWLKSSGRGFFDREQKLVRVVGMVADVTEHKQAEEALADMSRKLIEAQEQERARIGRELHDDINQRLAMLAVELEQLRDDPSEIQSRVQELRKQMTEISDDVQALSHELHSSKLEYLGVVAGIKSWCKEFAERQNIKIDFKSDVSSALPSEIGLSLFRVLQKALHNAVKHSGVRRFDVQLRENSGEVRLAITDSGRGFDVEAAMQGTG